MTYIPGAAAAAVRARGMDFAEQLKQMNQRKEDERRLELYPEMLRTLKVLLDLYDRQIAVWESWEDARNLIAKAEVKA